MTVAQQGMRLLIVDDDDIDRERLRRLLNKLGLQMGIVEATDQASAMQLFTENGFFDVVFLDSRLPDGDGVDLVDCFAEFSTVVFLSGTDDETVKKEAQSRGAQICLGKSELSLRSLKRAFAVHGRGV